MRRLKGFFLPIDTKGSAQLDAASTVKACMQADATAAVHALVGDVQAAPGALCASASIAMRGYMAGRKAPG